MAYCHSPSSNAYRPTISPSLSCGLHRRLFIRAQSFPDSQGRSSPRDMVDANLGTLRRRIEEVKMKEISDRCSLSGWGGYSDYSTTAKSSSTISQMASEGFELTCLVFGNIGLTIVGGSLLLCLTSLFINFCSTS